MLVRKASRDQIEDAARAAGLDLRDLQGNKWGSGYRFKLGLGEDRSRFRRYGPGGRRIAAVCHHGHWRFFREVFARVPGADILTVAARYRSLADLERIAPNAGTRNVGSLYDPIAYEDTCDCNALSLEIDLPEPVSAAPEAA